LFARVGVIGPIAAVINSRDLCTLAPTEARKPPFTRIQLCAVLKAKAAYMAAQPMAFWSRGEKISHSNSFCVAFVTEAFDSIADLKPSDGVAEALRLRLNAHLGDNPEMVRASRVKLRDAALAAGAEAGSAFKLYAGIPGVEAAKQLSHAPT
jgi:hypothetical protein